MGSHKLVLGLFSNDGERQTAPGFNILKGLNLRQIADDRDNPVRYVIYLNFGRHRYFLNLLNDTLCYHIDAATLFKRKDVAMAAAKACSDAKQCHFLVAGITTKNGERNVLKYDQ